MCVECAERITGRKDAGISINRAIAGDYLLKQEGGINMALCKKCGAQLDDDKKFCGSCGEAVQDGSEPQVQQYQYQQTIQQSVDRLAKIAQDTADETGGIDPADIQKNKAMGGLAYFLFFLPLVACPESKYGRFHANQGLVYLFLCIAGSIVRGILSSVLYSITWRLWWISSIISAVIWLPILAVGIIGLINGFSGKAKELPIIGKFRIIK